MKILLPAVAVLLLLNTPLLAEIAVGTSIEWMVADSDLVVRGRFLKSEDLDGWPKGWSLSSYQIEETLLGEARDSQAVLARDRSPLDAVKGGEYLLFLKRHRQKFDDEGLAAVAKRTPYGLRYQVRLDDLIEEFTIGCTTITDRDRLLQSVRGASRFKQGEVFRPKEYRLEVPTDTPAFLCLYGGSSVYLTVPADGRLAGTVAKWWESGDAHRQKIAMDAFAPLAKRYRNLEYTVRTGREKLESTRRDLSENRRLLRVAEAKLAQRDHDPAVCDRQQRTAKQVLADEVRTREKAEMRGQTAEAKLAACRTLGRNAIGAWDDSDPVKYLLELRLSALSPGPGDQEPLARLFTCEIGHLAEAARLSFWPVLLQERRQGGYWTITLCERVDGRVARNVLHFQANSDGELECVATVESRLYCFADEDGPHGWKSYFVNLGRIIRNERGSGANQVRVSPIDSTGVGYSIPEGMELVQLRLTEKNAQHWARSRRGVPVWAAEFITEEFRDKFPPTNQNYWRESNPTRR